jgi:hypothetical protein
MLLSAMHARQGSGRSIPWPEIVHVDGDFVGIGCVLSSRGGTIMHALIACRQACGRANRRKKLLCTAISCVGWNVCVSRGPAVLLWSLARFKAQHRFSCTAVILLNQCVAALRDLNWQMQAGVEY